MKRNAIDNLFPNQKATIAALRRVDTVFDEICRDYQLLSEEYPALNTEPGSQSYQLACDIRETLDGLRDEIVRSLRRAGKM
ncbi:MULTISPECIES: hypothetical protein [unclassified Ruegeria]|uniref:hypothetical protein n=1 Tax=unclassified Ruegeria TaxID=2625375 RepID=UPI001489F55D|nr:MULTISPECIES: hypothetical protein [unclassified Ruegeria]NOD65259.1 hypothetical protein [Ruegeria sp. HKCCD6109]